MNKFLVPLVFVIIAAIVFAFAQNIFQHRNEIAVVEFTEDEKEILSRVGYYNKINAAQNLLVFDYKTSDQYTSTTFWVEAYEYGKLVETINIRESYTDEAQPLNARADIVVTQGHKDQELSFQFFNTYKGEGTGAITAFPAATVSIKHGEDVYFTHAFGPITAPVGIETGKDIVLYSSIFSEGTLRTADEQSYITEPEQLSPYPHAQLIKCRFE